MLGKTPAELLGEKQARDATQIRLEAFAAGSPIRKMIRFVDAKGQERFFDQRVEPVRDGGGAVTGLLGVSLDVTERVLAQRRLQNSEEAYRTMVSRSVEPMVLLDSSATMLCLSPRAADLLGYTVAELEGTSALRLVDTADKLSLVMHYQDMLKHAPLPATATFRASRKGGDYIWISVTATFENYGQLSEKYLVKFDVIPLPANRAWDVLS